MFGQMSGNCGLAKLTCKIHHHAVLELSRYSIEKDSFTKVLVEMHFPVNSKMLDPFSSAFLAPSREHLTELAGKAGVLCGEQGCVERSEGESHLTWSVLPWMSEYNFQPSRSLHEEKLFCKLPY